MHLLTAAATSSAASRRRSYTIAMLEFYSEPVKAFQGLKSEIRFRTEAPADETPLVTPPAERPRLMS